MELQRMFVGKLEVAPDLDPIAYGTPSVADPDLPGFRRQNCYQLQPSLGPNGRDQRPEVSIASPGPENNSAKRVDGQRDRHGDWRA